jgi:hypothetical protein
MIEETLKKLGITDVKVLPEKTQRKIAKYKMMTKSPIGNDKEGNPHKGKKQTMDDLIEDIVFEVKLYQKTKDLKPANPPVETDKPDNSVQQTTELPKKGFLEDILGW